MEPRYRYVDAQAVTRKLDELIQKPIYSVEKGALANYEADYYGKRCTASRQMIDKALNVIPGGVQHNLAFNYPFPLVFTKADGDKLWDLDGNVYFDFLQAGGPTVLGSNPPAVRRKVEELLDTCGPSTGLFHEYEYLMADKIASLVPSVDLVRMFGSGTEACMGAIRVARLATKKKNVVKMGGAYHGWSDQLAYGIRIPGTKGLQSHGVPGYVFKHTQEFFPGVMTLHGEPLGGWGQYSLSPTMGAWVGHLFYLHWRYTQDSEFLRTRALPWCREVGTALRALMKVDPADGRLKLPLSTSPRSTTPACAPS